MFKKLKIKSFSFEHYDSVSKAIQNIPNCLKVQK